MSNAQPPVMHHPEEYKKYFTYHNLFPLCKNSYEFGRESEACGQYIDMCSSSVCVNFVCTFGTFKCRIVHLKGGVHRQTDKRERSNSSSSKSRQWFSSCSSCWRSRNALDTCLCSDGPTMNNWKERQSFQSVWKNSTISIRKTVYCGVCAKVQRTRI